MQLFFVRHGQTKANIYPGISNWDHDCPLTPEGRQQIIQACKNIESVLLKPALIVSSPLLRARQTAGILADALNLGLSINSGLREVNIGDWGRRPVADVNNDYRNLAVEKKPSFRPPSGETWIEVGARVAALVDDAESKPNKNQAIIFVSHDAPIRFGIGTLSNTDPSTWSDARYPTGSVTRLDKDAKGWRVASFWTPPQP